MGFVKYINKAKEYSIWFWKWKYKNYALILLAFGVWMVFLSPNNLFVQYKLAKELRDLKDVKVYYQEEINRNNDFIKLFSADTAFMEAYGREEYLMKRKNEDIYTILRQEDIENYRKGND